MRKLFLLFSAAILIAFASAKVSIVVFRPLTLPGQDPVLPFVPYLYTIAIAALLELLLAGYIVYSLAKNQDPLKVLLGFSICLGLYRIGLAQHGFEVSCKCMGNAGRWLFASPTTESKLSLLVLISWITVPAIILLRNERAARVNPSAALGLVLLIALTPLSNLSAAPIRISVNLKVQDQPAATTEPMAARMDVELDGAKWRIRQRYLQHESIEWNDGETTFSMTLNQRDDKDRGLSAIAYAGQYPQMTSTFVNATWFAYCSREYLSKNSLDMPDPYEPALTEPGAHICQLNVETLTGGLPAAALFIADPKRLSQARQNPLLRQEYLSERERKIRLAPIATLYPPDSLRTEYAVQASTNIAGLQLPTLWNLKKYSTRPVRGLAEQIIVTRNGITNYLTSELTGQVISIEMANALSDPFIPPTATNGVSVTDYRASNFRSGFDFISYNTRSLPFPETNSQMFLRSFQRKLGAVQAIKRSQLANQIGLWTAMALAVVSVAVWTKNKTATSKKQ